MNLATLRKKASPPVFGAPPSIICGYGTPMQMTARHKSSAKSMPLSGQVNKGARTKQVTQVTQDLLSTHWLVTLSSFLSDAPKGLACG